MRPKERRESGQTDLLRSRLDHILNMDHALVKLAKTIDWRFLEERLGEVYDDDPGRPPLPTRLMAGLAILKSMHNLSDESLCERWLENPYFRAPRPGWTGVHVSGMHRRKEEMSECLALCCEGA